ncbi:MAG: CpaF family protein [Acidimicrobiia bacterium]
MTASETVRRIRAEVAEQLSKPLGIDGDGAPSALNADSERQLARKLIADALSAEAARQISLGQPPLDAANEHEVAQAVFDSLYGLGRLQRILEDATVTDIHINGCDRVFVKRTDGSRAVLGPVAESDAELVELIRTAAARFGRSERRFDAAAPELNLQLPDGSRLFAVQAVSERPSLAIRLHRHQKVFLDDLVGLGMIDHVLGSFLRAAVRSRQNIIIAGGTGVGKTTLLRACANEIAPEERLVTVEDALELGLDRFPELHPNVVSFEERRANTEGEGAVSMSDLVRWGLRMDPDRVIVGEVRGDEVLPMLNAMSQGNDGSLATIHSDSSHGVFTKLALYAVQTPQRLPLEATNLLVANSIDLVVFCTRNRYGERFVSSVREVTGAEDRLVLSNEVFRPGREGRARPGAPIRDVTMRELMDAGFDPGGFHAAMEQWT